MHHIGIDLAWGESAPTGVAVLDATGRLLGVQACGSDATILAAVAEYAAGPCVVAFDAPLVVVNATGSRPCERALGADFRRFDAGTHPSNTARPWFADGPRAARIATALGLDPDPASTGPRRAVEVHPHAATVALFRLGRILAYKNKRGRGFELLRDELRRLMEHLESLRDAEVPLDLDHRSWQDLRDRVTAATRKAELRVVEDQVDAVVCAYVALLVSRAPERLTTYGDAATGVIVTPTLPADLVPAPRPPRTPRVADPVSAAVQEYAAAYPALVATTADMVELVTRLLDDAGINYLTVTGRTKSVASFATKAFRTVGGEPAFSDPLRQITDQIGVRVITYVHRDVEAVAEALADQLVVLTDRDMGQETAGEGRFGYASRHLLLAQPDRPVQVQVRTVLQHAWAEFEHDIRYKGTIPDEHASDFDRRFTLAAGLLELADREFSTIHDRLTEWMRHERPEIDPSDPRIGAHELARFLAAQYSEAGWSRTDHYGWMSGLLLELGVTSLHELTGLLRSVDPEAINARMDYQYPPGAVRRLDDALLAIFGERYLALTGNAHRRAALTTRLARLRTPPER